MKPYLKLYLFFSCLILLLSGCSSVKIQKLVIGKEIQSIQNWSISNIPIEIEYSGNERATQTLNPIIDLNSMNQRYVNEVYIELLKNHNESFYQNMIGSGEIQIFVHNSKELKFNDTKYNVHENETKNKRDRSTTGIQPTVLIDKDAPINRIESKIRITYISIYTYNHKQELIGEIKVSGDNIKPKKRLCHKFCVNS